MRNSILLAISLLILVQTGIAQENTEQEIPRNAFGQPDFQGFYT